jgi:hypothetical protein
MADLDRMEDSLSTAVLQAALADYVDEDETFVTFESR